MGDTKKESRDDRIERLKRKFMGLQKIRRLLEYVRYKRALDGELPHRFPKEYLEECTEALRQMVEDDFKDSPNLDRFLDLAHNRRSTPFIDDAAKKP